MYSTVLLSLLTKSVPSAGGVAGKRVLVRMLCPYQISLLSGKRFSMSEIVATRSSTRSVEWVAGFVLSGLLLVMVLYGTGIQWNTKNDVWWCLSGFFSGATRRILNIFCCY